MILQMIKCFKNNSGHLSRQQSLTLDTDFLYGCFPPLAETTNQEVRTEVKTKALELKSPVFGTCLLLSCCLLLVSWRGSSSSPKACCMMYPQPTHYIKTTETALNQHCWGDGALSARLFLTNWALKQRGALKARADRPVGQSAFTVKIFYTPDWRRDFWGQAALTELSLAPPHHSKGLFTRTRTMRGHLVISHAEDTHLSCQELGQITAAPHA